MCVDESRNANQYELTWIRVSTYDDNNNGEEGVPFRLKLNAVNQCLKMEKLRMKGSVFEDI